MPSGLHFKHFVTPLTGQVALESLFLLHFNNCDCFVFFSSHIGISKINRNPCQKLTTTAPSHRPPMLGGCTHFLAMIHIPCYTYDTSTVTLGSRTPHLPNGAFCSHSGPLWKDPTKDGPRARPSFIFQAFCHWEKAAGTSVKLSENGWKIHLFQQIFADRSAICSANYKFTKTQMRKLSDRLRWLTWTGFFFFFLLPPSPERFLPVELGNIAFLNGDARSALKMVALCILCIFIGLLCIPDLSGSSEE